MDKLILQQSKDGIAKLIHRRIREDDNSKADLITMTINTITGEFTFWESGLWKSSLHLDQWSLGFVPTEQLQAELDRRLAENAQ